MMFWRPGGLVGHFELDELLRSHYRRRRVPSSQVIDRSSLHIGADTLLRAEGVFKAYAGVQALNDVSVQVHTGEIVGLIGANGSGKSTLVNVISGVTKADKGAIHLGERDITRTDSPQRARLGLARTFQSMRLFSGLTVGDNVLVAAKATAGKEELATALATEGILAGKRDLLATTLSYGDQRRVEIARALALRPSFLLLDEPAAGMNDAESDQLADNLRATVRQTGIGLLIVDHDMRMMAKLCERLVVLDHGVRITEGTPADVLADPQVGALYLGSEAVDAESEVTTAVTGSGQASKGVKS